eukprot:TRINITY_DN4014_c0_g1_i1.p1 TRINITY_DN4014_c0_g1~~TRINITY_DN4014_c0_g1_i1.p1  ORF type:complete len:266 (+),score=54.87 TRINITY_DN4014_c0_g1_i1:95-892(+)
MFLNTFARTFSQAAKAAPKSGSFLKKLAVFGASASALGAGLYYINSDEKRKSAAIQFGADKILKYQMLSQLKGNVKHNSYIAPFRNFKFNLGKFQDLAIQDSMRLEGTGVTIVNTVTKDLDEVQCAVLSPNQAKLIKEDKTSFTQLPLFLLTLEQLQNPYKRQSKVVYQTSFKPPTPETSRLIFTIMEIPDAGKPELNQIITPSRRGVMFFTRDNWSYSTITYTISNPAPTGEITKEEIADLKNRSLSIFKKMEFTPETDAKRRK